MDSKVVSKLAHELKEFISKNLSDDRSEFSQIKIFCSAHLHDVKKNGFFFGPSECIQNESDEIKNLFGFVFFDIEKNILTEENIGCFQGINDSHVQKLLEKPNLSTMFRNSAFILLKNLKHNPAKGESIKSYFFQIFERSHFFLEWGNYSLWWKIYQLNEPQHKLPKNFPFGDPVTLDRGIAKFVNENEPSNWPYKPESVQLPHRYFNSLGEVLEVKDTHVKTGFTIKKRLLVECDKFFVCGKTGISTGPDKVMILDVRSSKYREHLGGLYVANCKKYPNRKIEKLEGTWVAVHVQNTAIGHFIFEVLKPLLYISRLKKFKLLITGVSLPKHLLEFFLVESVLKDKITEIRVADSGVLYKADKTLTCFENHREIRPEDCLNLQWFGESVLKRNPLKKAFKKKIYISRRDSPESRAVLNENALIRILSKQGYEIVQLDKFSLPEKLFLIKHADQIITPAGSGALFRHLVSTDGSLRVLLTREYHWSDFILFILGGGMRNESVDLFDPEPSLGSSFINFSRNHASFWLPNTYLNIDF